MKILAEESRNNIEYESTTSLILSHYLVWEIECAIELSRSEAVREIIKKTRNQNSGNEDIWMEGTNPVCLQI